MILLTGGSGFLGSALLSRFYQKYPNEEIFVLLRADSEKHAISRLKESCSSLFKSFEEFGYSEQEILRRVIPVPGDVSLADLGISTKFRDRMLSSVSNVYHSAANTHLALPLEQSKNANLLGTKHVLEFLKQITEHRSSDSNSSYRFCHISTAYVAGNTTEIICSSALNLSRNFRNSYEQSKAEAEALVQDYKKYFPVLIFRPSVIVGDSTTGRTSAFNVLYIPARIICSGLLKVIPAIPHAPFDIVPIDYVANTIVKSHALDFENGDCYHLTAGVGRESNPAQIVELLFKAASNYSGKDCFSKPSFISPEVLSQDVILRAIHSVTNLATNIYQTQAFKNFEKILGQKLPILNQVLPFIPYMISNPQFDTSKTIDKFGDIGLPPLFEHYADTIFKYCLESRWGRVAV